MRPGLLPEQGQPARPLERMLAWLLEPVPEQGWPPAWPSRSSRLQARRQALPSAPMGLKQRAPVRAGELPAARENAGRPTAVQAQVRQAQPVPVLPELEGLQVRHRTSSRIRSRLPSA